MIQHKFKVAEESIPPEYKDAYQDIQHADVLVYKAFKDENTNQPLPPPQEIVRTPIPPEVANTFASTDQMMQNILGSFDIQMGKLNSSQLSGIAIQESVTQSNATAMPYVVGYLHALTRVANTIVNLIPKYFKTPRTVPVLSVEGKRSFVEIDKDDPSKVSMDYPEDALQVKVEAGVNFTVQKTRALQQIISMMQASPLFAQFMNTEGLPILLDNLEIRGIDQLKLLADGFVKKMQAAQAKQQQMPNPIMLKEQNAQQLLQLKGQELQFKQTQLQSDNSFRAQEINNDQNDIDNDRLKIMLEQQQAGINDAVQIKKAQAEERNDAAQLSLKAADTHHKHALAVHDQLHRHAKDAIGLTHDAIGLSHDAASLQNQIKQSNKPQPTGINQNG
jgi:hypothetical protein